MFLFVSHHLNVFDNKSGSFSVKSVLPVMITGKWAPVLTLTQDLSHTIFWGGNVWGPVWLFMKTNPPHTVHRKQKANALADLKQNQSQMINKAKKKRIRRQIKEIQSCSTQELPAMISSLSLDAVICRPNAISGYSKTWKWMLLAGWVFVVGTFCPCAHLLLGKTQAVSLWSIDF